MAIVSRKTNVFAKETHGDSFYPEEKWRTKNFKKKINF